MKKRSAAFIFVDALLIILMILPIAGLITLYILTTPASEGIQITGARIYFTLDTPIQPFPITESQVNSLAVVLVVFWFCLFITHGIKSKPTTRRQLIAEWIVETTENLVRTNMDPYFDGFAPFVAAIMALSALSSLLTLFGLYPPTSDLNIVAGWALLVFILITHYKMKAGPLNYLKSFADPIPLTPLNVISEIATPVSMSFRHYGNVLSGSVISVLVAAGLGGLSSIVLGRLPGALASFPLFRIGIPAVLSVYFDIFSGCLQAFIFAMLTMLYITNGFPADEYARRRARKAAKAKR